MKWHQNMPRIPVVVIALFAMLLGALVAARFMPAAPIDWNRSRAFSVLNLAGIGFVAVVVVCLLILKSMDVRRARIQQDLLEAFLEHIPDNVYFKDRDSRFIRISRAMAGFFGLADPKQIVNKSDSDLFSSEHASKALADEQEIMNTGRSLVGIEEKETWPDGREGWALTTKIPLRNRKGEIIGTMGISRDITERKHFEERIHHMALHDALTGLANRTLLHDLLGQTIALAGRNKKRVAVLMLDVDRFKHVNDSLGHHGGDRLLQAMSVRLKSCLRESDIVARFGGDEFVICLPSIAGKQDIANVAHKVLATLVEPFQIEGHELRISSSIGISQYPADGESPESMLQAADAAMHEAKTKGRGIYRFFAPELNQDARRRQKLEKDLHQACARGEFVLYYQPMVSTESSHITGVEALMRWRHPEEGLIPPNQFIPLLEELGLMAEVGRWALRAACLQNVAWEKEGLPPIRVAVNVSAQQFHRGNLVRTVEEVLRETGLDPHRLELELTESLTLDESETTIQVMHDLKRLGVSLSLDDFGTGWSSLSYLRRFPLGRLKIDRSFMRDIPSEPAAKAVVRSIMDLARNLGLACTGEGVETMQQLDYLKDHGCTEIQGFLYSPPLPADDCRELLRLGKAGLIAVPDRIADCVQV